MPRLVGYVDIKFVAEDWKGPEQGYKWEVIRDPDHIAHYAEYFDAGLRRAREVALQCNPSSANIDDQEHLCGPTRSDGTPHCVFWMRRIQDATRTSERTMLVRVHVPVAD